MAEEEGRQMIKCGRCSAEVKPIMGALFALNNIYYHPDCWPEEENIAATFFTGSGEGSQMLTTKTTRADDDKA